MKISLAFVALAFLAGCASGGSGSGRVDPLYSPFANMSRGQCGNADWRDKGRVEGRRGAPREIIQSYYDFCEKHGEPPDEELFYEGYEVGLRQRQASG
ncbi:MAG: hypothetical protein AAF763_18410 [Pseudomonadota bacterium]